MNMASIVVLCIVAVLLALAVAGFLRESAGGCDGNCGVCMHSCPKEDFEKR